MKLLCGVLTACLFFVSTLAADILRPDFTIQIPMRDGMHLTTDLYLPSPDARGLPCILLRSPSGRNLPLSSFYQLAKAGYVIAVQETRNTQDIEGKTFPFLSDAWGKLQDGYDTVEWLANSPYTNGRIGTWGPSALGITQLLMAPSQPPHLQCQYVMNAAACIYRHAMFPGGQMLKHQIESWLGFYAHDAGVYGTVSQLVFYNDFWHQFNSSYAADKVQVPGIHIGGWYDTFLMGTLEAFTSRQHLGGPGAKGTQKLVVGPWTHFWPTNTKLGEFDVPHQGYQPPYDISPKRWFDHYLKGEADGIEGLPNVIYYVMGPFDGSPGGNVWKTAEDWPVPSDKTSLYLTSGNSLQASPVEEKSTLAYVYDPRKLIPTHGGRNLFLLSGPTDQSATEKRDDVLVFTTGPLEDDLEVTGYLTAEIFFSTDQPDTDIVVKLSDVYPDGKSLLISEGGYRLSVKAKQEGEEPLKTGVVRMVPIDLWATSQVFAKGHAIRCTVSSSNYPRYECNLNVGILGNHMNRFNVAHNTVYMGKETPSRLILPVVPKESKESSSATSL